MHALKYLPGTSIHSIIGILNGTSNYVLSQMHRHHIHLEEAVNRAVKRGITESDVDHDLQGIDAAEKLMILCMAGFGMTIKKKDISLGHIRAIDLNDIEMAEELDCRIKQLAVAQHSGGQLFCSVSPHLVPVAHPLAVSDGVVNSIFINYDQTDSLSFLGKAVDGKSTSRAVLSDLLHILETAEMQSIEILKSNIGEVEVNVYLRPKVYIRIKDGHRKTLQYIYQHISELDIEFQANQGKDIILTTTHCAHDFHHSGIINDYLTVLPILHPGFPCNA